jgi:hypothetical protein
VSSCESIQGRLFDGDELASDVAHAADCAACGALRARVLQLRTMDDESADDEAPSVAEVLARALDEGTGAAANGAAADGAAPTVDPSLYEVERVLGQGGMGIVLVARDRRLGRRVALKELRKPTRESRERFQREALLTARLQHPAIVAIHEAGQWPSGRPFYAMPLVRGRPLNEVIAATQTTPERMALLPNVLAVTDALAYAHEQRVIHRDLKPANVLVGDHGETVVIDWGLAKDLDAARGASASGAGGAAAAAAKPVFETAAGSTLGTPSHMAPEQAQGRNADERADVYALGALLYHVLAGRPPYVGRDEKELFRQLLAGPPAPLGEVVAGLPRDLLAIVAKAMERAPEQRYATAKELAQDLRRFQAGQLVAVHRYGAGERAGRWVRRHRAPAGAAAVAAIALGVVAVIGLGRLVRARAAAERETAAVLEEAGRLALLAGHPLRAAAYLTEAYALSEPAGRAAEPLRALLGRAMTVLAQGRGALAHGGEITALGVTADGTKIATGGAGAARLWDARSGALLATVAGATTLAALPDSGAFVTRGDDGTARRVALAGADGTVTVTDAATGRRWTSLDVGTGETLAVLAGSVLVTAPLHGGVARVWEPAPTDATATAPETRPAAEVSAALARLGPWRVERGVLVAAGGAPE